MKNRPAHFYLLITLLPFHFFYATGQTDSLVLPDVSVEAYLGQRPLLRVPGSVAVIDSAMHKQHGQSLVPVMNMVAGVRMEERSPGSYRLSIRGSLLRSPFGVRNVKVYLDEFALTNAGGETYINLLDVNNQHNIEILKGPDGSLFGANSGGVVRINPINNHSDHSLVRLQLQAGSFGALNENITVQQRIKKHVLSVGQGYQRTDGYRENSKMARNYVHLADRFNYGNGSELRALLVFSELRYQTPGGLTLEEYTAHPSSARPATRNAPGAIEQKTGVSNETFFAGIANDLRINGKLRHVISVFGSGTQFNNPFITNYETRDEWNAGGRTWLELREGNNRNTLVMNLGGEGQYMGSNITNAVNNAGTRDRLLVSDNVKALQAFGFLRALAEFNNRWTVETSLSYNFNQFHFERQFPSSADGNKNITPQVMPRIAASWLIGTSAFRAIVSRGYSPPSLQEVRSSNLEINLALQTESGWNYELGWRTTLLKNRFWYDVATFYYALEDAIVRRVDEAGAEYFVNAGETFQPGVESQIGFDLIKRNSGFVRGLQVSNATTYSYFRFGNYNNGSEVTGNAMTGVPEVVSVTGTTLRLPVGFYVFGQYQYTDRIPLNDANTAYALPYHLLLLKAGWTKTFSKRALDLSLAADNLLNQQYSLGHDLNAFGGRYYNAAPPRNFMLRVMYQF